MPKYFLISISIIVALLLAAGCGDDECPSCPSNVDTVTVTENVTDTLTDTLNIEYRHLVVGGEVSVYEGFISFWCEIYDIEGRIPEFDSLTVAGELVDMRLFYDWGVPAYGTEWESETGGYASGDEVEIIIYTPYGTATATGTLRHYMDNALTIADWATSYPWDTVDVSTSILLDWIPLMDGDWYSITGYHYYDSLGSQFSRLEDWTLDTTYTIPAESNGFDGYWDIYIYSILGPTPDDPIGSFTGCDAISGRILSDASKYTRIYVGDGNASPVPTSAKTLPAETDRQVIRRLLNLPQK